MKTPLIPVLLWLTAAALAPLSSQAQPFISPNPPNSGAYIPTTTRVPGIVNSLTLPGYDFELMEISGQPVLLRMDGQTIGTAKSGNAGSLGFTAEFALANQTTVPRTFQFAANYYANLRVGFRVLDANDNIVWQSYQILVDIPPFAPPVTVTLGKNATWNYRVFVPIYQQGAFVLGPGTYRLEAEVLGSPAYSVRSEFTVGVLVGGPIIKPTLLPN